MQTNTVQYKLIKKIKDERFDEDSIHQYYLLLNIGSRDLQVGVIDSADGRMLLLEDYVFPSLAGQQELMAILEQLFDVHAILRAAFWKQIRIGLKNNKFAQVPEALFAAEAGSEYLRYNAQLSPDDTTLHIPNPRAAAITVFAIPAEIKQWFEAVYAGKPLIWVHQSAALIEGVMDVSARAKENPLYIYVDRFKLHIVCCRNNKLIYYNQFVIKQFSDYIRYIMLVMNSLQLNQQTSQVMLWGYIGRNSPHYHEFYKYINNVGFGQRPGYLKFGYMFDEIQDHHFLDLFCMHLLGNKI